MQELKTNRSVEIPWPVNAITEHFQISRSHLYHLAKEHGIKPMKWPSVNGKPSKRLFFDPKEIANLLTPVEIEN